MNTLCKTVILLLFVNVALISPASAAWFGSGAPSETVESDKAMFATLAEMADAMAKEFKEENVGAGLKLYLDREDIREDQEARCVPFAGMLVNELERAFSRVGYNFEGRIIDQADYMVTVSYHRTPDRVMVYLKLKGTKNDSYRNLKGNYELSLNQLQQECFIENLDHKLARLTQKVSQGMNRSSPLSLLVSPVVEARRKYSSPFSEYATGKFKTHLSSLTSFRLIESTPVVKNGATRSIGKSADLTGADALLAGADAILEGFYIRGADMINLSLTIKDLKGKVLANSDENIPLGLVPFSLDNEDAEILSRIADTEHEKPGVVRISTAKGGSYQVFRDGETVSFTIQVSRPLYIYVYDINPNGTVTLLYPKEGEPELPKQPGYVYSLPEENDPWEIKVEAPFGKDAVKLFASDKRLAIPRISSQTASRSFYNGTRSLIRMDKVQKELASQPTINGHDMVDYYKGIAAKKGAVLYESTVYVETRAN